MTSNLIASVTLMSWTSFVTFCGSSATGGPCFFIRLFNVFVQVFASKSLSQVMHTVLCVVLKLFQSCSSGRVGSSEVVDILVGTWYILPLQDKLLKIDSISVKLQFCTVYFILGGDFNYRRVQFYEAEHLGLQRFFGCIGHALSIPQSD